MKYIQVYPYVVTTVPSISTEKTLWFVKMKLKSNEYHNQVQLYVIFISLVSSFSKNIILSWYCSTPAYTLKLCYYYSNENNYIFITEHIIGFMYLNCCFTQPNSRGDLNDVSII